MVLIGFALFVLNCICSDWYWSTCYEFSSTLNLVSVDWATKSAISNPSEPLHIQPTGHINVLVAEYSWVVMNLPTALFTVLLFSVAAEHVYNECIFSLFVHYFVLALSLVVSKLCVFISREERNQCNLV